MRRTTARLTGLLALLSLAGAGCLPTQTTTRSQAGDDTADAEQLATVGQKTEFGNMEPVPVSSVGFVHGLEGTGSVPVSDGWRTQLETALRRQKFDPKELLDDPALSQSLVLVSALIPPGAREGDAVDVAVSLPQGSRTRSLKGGVLAPCELANAELAANARSAMQAQGISVGKVPAAADNTILTGFRMARAEGRLLAGHDGAATEDGPKAARIWGGGKVLVNRPYYFLLNETNPSPNTALLIAERLNAVFHAQGDPTGKLAEAKVQSNQPLVVCGVPAAYRLNHRRFLTVARHVPLTPLHANHPRRQLADDLLRPETALASAVKLEALGLDSRQPLRVGLQSDSPWVKFASAESLAYLGHSDGVEELARLAADHPALRTQCLTALASLDDAICLDKLADMMKSPDAALRYGAFVALRSADANHDAVRGKTVNGSFQLHFVAPEATPMVHVATQGRSEVVLFGDRFPLRTPYAFALGKDFTVSVQDGEPTVTVTRITTDAHGDPVPVTRTCLNDVGLVLRTLADLGGGFPEAVEFVRRAQTTEVVTQPVIFDSAPRGMSLVQLAAISRTDPTVEKANAETTRAALSDIQVASFDDLPTEGQAIQKVAPEPERDLAREPGRLFGPKRPATPAPEPEPLVK